MLDRADPDAACSMVEGLDAPALLLELTEAGGAIVLAANRASRQLTGLAPAEVLGRDLARLLPPLCATLRSDRRVRPPEVARVLDAAGRPRAVALTRLHAAAADLPRRLLAMAMPAEDPAAARPCPLERVLDLQPDYIFRLAPDGRILYANAASAALRGATPTSLVGRSVYDGLPEPRQQLIRRRMAALRASPDAGMFEDQVQRPDGTTAWQEWTARGVRDPAGGLVEVVVVGRDITARRQAQQRLSESEQRYRQLLDTSPDAVLVEIDHRIVMANRRSAELFGFDDVEALLGQDPFSFLPQGSRRLALARRDRLLAGASAGPPVEVQLQPRGDGACEIELSAAPITVDGRPAVVMTMRDIGPRKRQERQLRASELRFRRLVESMPEAFLILQDGRCAFANDAAARLVGLARGQDLASRPFLELVDPPDHQRIDRLGLQLALDPGRQETLEVALLHRDGRRVELEATAMTIQHFERPAIQITARDVTARKAEQAAIAHMALHDPLTGLANRARLRGELERACARGRRDGGRTGLLCLDLDGFKAVNDRLGHAAGDAVLIEVGRRLRDTVRDSDLPARLGGDEFAVLLGDVEDAAGVELLARRLIAAISAPIVIGGEAVRVGTSIGSTVFPDDPAPIDALLAHADMALYAAKRSGRGVHQAHAAASLARPAEIPSLVGT